MDISKLKLTVPGIPMGDQARYVNPAVSIAKENLKAMRGLMSGEATFIALIQAVKDLTAAVPKENDILISAFGINVLKVRYIEPHTFLFEGFDDEGRAAFAACHFSQLVAHIIYLPKRGAERVVTGFAEQKANG